MEEELENFSEQEEVDSFLHLSPSTPNLTIENKIIEKFNRIIA